MSKLEIFIKRCREIWEELYVEPRMMDDMIDTFVKPGFDIEKVTDEDIKLSTQSYINDYAQKLNETKEKHGTDK
jgi:hypothetical protein